MPETYLQPNAQPLAQTAATFLAYGRSIDLASLALTLLALAGVFWGAMPPLSQIGCFLAAALGGLQKFYAMRVAFDQQLFAGWAKRWDAAADPEADLATLDATLIAVGLRATPAAASRPLADRIRGAFQLLKRQAVILALQFAALLIAAWSCLLPLATL